MRVLTFCLFAIILSVNAANNTREEAERRINDNMAAANASLEETIKSALNSTSNSTINTTEHAVEQFLQITRALLNWGVRKSFWGAEKYVEKAADTTVPPSMTVVRHVTKRIIDIALNETIKATGDIIVSGLDGTQELMHIVKNSSEFYFNGYMQNATKFVNKIVNKTVSDKGRLSFINKASTKAVNKTSSIYQSLFRITANLTNNLLNKTLEITKKVVANSTKTIQAIVHNISQPVVDKIIRASTPVSNGLVDFAIRQMFYHSVASGEQAVNYTMDVIKEYTADARFIPDIANSLAAWKRVNFTTGEGMVNAVLTTKKAYEEIYKDAAELSEDIPGAGKIGKLGKLILKSFPPSYVAMRLLKSFGNNPEHVIKIWKDINELSSSLLKGQPISATKSSYNLISTLAADIYRGS